MVCRCCCCCGCWFFFSSLHFFTSFISTIFPAALPIDSYYRDLWLRDTETVRARCAHEVYDVLWSTHEIVHSQFIFVFIFFFVSRSFARYYFYSGFVFNDFHFIHFIMNFHRIVIIVSAHTYNTNASINLKFNSSFIRCELHI